MKLYNKDCLKVMRKMVKKGKKIDCLLTDPPYGMNFVSNYRKEKYDKIANDDNFGWLDEFAKLSFDLANDNTAHYVFCSFHNIDKFKIAFEKHFKVKNILVWEKNNTSMGDLSGDFAPKVEFILFLTKGRRTINGKRDPNIFRFARTGNKHHPTEKPVDLIEYLLEKFTDPGDLIFDPFMGSGSTGVACVNKGMDFIGVELDETYFKTAKKRIKGVSNG